MWQQHQLWYVIFFFRFLKTISRKLYYSLRRFLFFSDYKRNNRWNESIYLNKKIKFSYIYKWWLTRFFSFFDEYVSRIKWIKKKQNKKIWWIIELDSFILYHRYWNYYHTSWYACVCDIYPKHMPFEILFSRLFGWIINGNDDDDLCGSTLYDHYFTNLSFF